MRNQLYFGIVLLVFVLFALPKCSTVPVPAPQGSEVPVTITAPSPPPVAAPSINALISASACTTYNWLNRGKAPIGYITGTVEAFQHSYCAKRPVMAQALGPSSTDALAWYGVQASLVNDYTLLIGLGMRESSGNYGEGYDTSAGTETASEAEAGAWQFSFNSIGASPALQTLYTEYQKAPQTCLLSVFSHGARGSYQSVVGTGSGAAFQSFTKSCPAFQAEYTATLIRVLKNHFGPLVRKEAEFNLDCQKLLTQVQAVTLCP